MHSGNPSLYGAIGEQIRWLVELRIDYDITPGVPAYAAAAAALGRELTLPELLLDPQRPVAGMCRRSGPIARWNSPRGRPYTLRRADPPLASPAPVAGVPPEKGRRQELSNLC